MEPFLFSDTAQLLTITIKGSPVTPLKNRSVNISIFVQVDASRAFDPLLGFTPRSLVDVLCRSLVFARLHRGSRQLTVPTSSSGSSTGIVHSFCSHKRFTGFMGLPDTIT